MNTYVVWIEMDRAKVFKMAPGGTQRQSLKRREIKHHTSRDPKNHKDCEKFFHSIASAVKDADELYLMGPGLTKEHFKKHLLRHHHQAAARCVVGEETMDITSDARLLAHARKFFKKYDLFERPIP